MVSTNPPSKFQIEIFRTGYYGGRGARLMTTLGPFNGTKQPDPQIGPKNLHECQWKPATTVKIPADWVSGVYLGRLTAFRRMRIPACWQSYVVFIVRDDRPADILFQCSDNTWNAYNQWPSHYSVYTHPKGNQGPWADVSFDRPYGRYAQFTSVVNDPLSVGAGEFISFEFPLSYFLEQHGYDVSYVSNSDMVSPERGLKCKAFISVGHDEYWDRRQYDSVVKMRDNGVNILFLSGNAVCWVTPLKKSSDGRPARIMFRGGPYGGDYKWAVDREKVNGPFPERGPDEGYLIGARNVEPDNGGGDWIVTKPDHWIFAGTGMKAGERIPGLIGWEYHGDPPQDFPASKSWPRERPSSAARGRKSGRRRFIPVRKRTSSSTPRRSSGSRGSAIPPGTRSPGRTGAARTAPTSAYSRSRTTCCGGRLGKMQSSTHAPRL